MEGGHISSLRVPNLFFKLFKYWQSVGLILVNLYIQNLDRVKTYILSLWLFKLPLLLTDVYHVLRKTLHLFHVFVLFGAIIISYFKAQDGYLKLKGFSMSFPFQMGVSCQ